MSQTVTKLSRTDLLLERIRSGADMSRWDQFRLTWLLAIPSMVAQIATILMNYIDASMVGHLGADESASVGLVSTSIWLIAGLTNSVSMGFSVQVAHLIGAGDREGARNVLRQSLVATFVIGLIIGTVGLMISGALPSWLRGQPDIQADASLYFAIFSLLIPVLQLDMLGAAMLRCSGNIKFPSLLYACMCLLDVLFNFLLIYPTRVVRFNESLSLTIPGADLGVGGAALGTALAEVVTMFIMLYYLVFRSKELRLWNGGLGHTSLFLPTRTVLRRAVHIGLPMALQHIAMCSAQILITTFVAPLGKFAIAANSFGVTAESICYMPGYGISEAATTLVGQSIGAGRNPLARRFAYIAVGSGIFIMSVMGIFLYIGAPVMMALFSPVQEIITLGTDALRIEAFAEPMFAAAIVTYGVCVGAGDTLKPALMNLGRMWGVRITLCWLLASQYGLNGVWFAMATELTFRGIIFLFRLRSKAWLKTLA